MGVLPSIGHALADNGAAAAAAWGDGRRAARAQDRRWTDLPSRSTVRREAVLASAIEPGTASLVEWLCCVWSAHGRLTPCPQIQDQIAKASSSNATATRWFTGSSTASS